MVKKILKNLSIAQVGFKPNRTCSAQVLHLITYIEAGFQKILKTSVVIFDLMATSDTVS